MQRINFRFVLISRCWSIPHTRMTRKPGRLREDVAVPKNAPPFSSSMPSTIQYQVQNSLLLAAEAKKSGVPAEVHVYDTGGHGYGLRPQADKPVTTWPARCAEWMARNGWLQPAAAPAAGK
jgi:hypothetical protein